MATDRESMIKFVRLMERHPCLYNPKALDYNDPDLKRKAWASIAREYNSPVLVCKEQWRKIRTAFLKSIRVRASTSGPRKPYYLYKHLKFIVPFIKPKCVSDDSIEKFLPPEGADSDSEFDIPESDRNRSDDDYQYEVLDSGDFQDDEQELPSQSYRARKVEYCEIGNAFSKRDRRSRQNDGNGDNEPNPRLLFLNSIKPEVMSFSEQEMRLFRRTVIDAIDSIMRARETQ